MGVFDDDHDTCDACESCGQIVQQAGSRHCDSCIDRMERIDRRPQHGSKEWAETYSDDLGESPDY